MRSFTLAALLLPAFAPGAAMAQGATGAGIDPGAYLAARVAGTHRDFAEAAPRFLDALARDPDNLRLMEGALTGLIGMGDMNGAIALSHDFIARGVNAQAAHMMLAAEAAMAGDWNAIITGPTEGREIGPLIDGLSRGWALLGKGEMSAALDAFDAVIDGPGLRGFGLYHKALALAVVGDFEGADAIFSLPPQEGMQRTRRSTLAHVQVLSQLDRNADAVALLDETFGTNTDPAIADLRARLEAGEDIAFTHITDARQGLAETYYSVGTALGQQANQSYVLIYARVVNLLDPGHVEGALFTAGILEGLDQFDLANAAYNLVPADDLAFHAAELGRADVLRRAGQPDAAVEVLDELAQSFPGLATVHAALGDQLRGLERFDEANTAYGRAIPLFDPQDPALWFVYFSRGITWHQLDHWPEAEADFRHALELRPGQPHVLNYLGYSLVERREDLDEALAMIEEAVRAQPQNGAIVDSLGWAQFRLGQYDDAVFTLERATELLPLDAEINDHLGDAYWAVGRVNEARFQWQRALSLDSGRVEAERVRQKLAMGLDAVLAQEGAAPLRLAQEDASQ